MSSKIKYSLEEVKKLIERYENLKSSGKDLIEELRGVMSENSEIVHLFHHDDQSLSFRFMDVHFMIQVEIHSHRINSNMGHLRFYLFNDKDQSYKHLEGMSFSFDDQGNIQQSDDFYHFSADVFPYVFISMLTDYIISNKLVISPKEIRAKLAID